MKIFKILITLTFIFGLTAILAPVANAANFYISPSSKKVGIGETVSVQVRLNSNEVVNAVSSYISYPTDKIEVLSVSYGGSAFAISAENSFGGGLIKISRGNINGVRGDLNIATLSFRPKTLGTANLNFASGSAIVRESDSANIMSGNGSGIISVTSEPQTSNSISSTLGLPVLSDIKVTEIATNSATISWTTDIESDSTVLYGLDKDLYILSSTNSDLTKKHQIKIQNPLLIPGNIYHFVVSSKTKGGIESKSDDQIFQLKGFNIKIKVQNPILKPLAGVEITIDTNEKRYKTDSSGEVLISDMSPGKHVLTARMNGQEKTEIIEVKSIPDTQNFDIVLSNSSGIFGVNYLVWALIFLSILIGAGIVFFILIFPRIKKPKNPFENFNNPIKQ